MKEIFNDIPNYIGLYQISNLGRVKSLSRKVNHYCGGLKLVKEKILKPILNGGGYYHFVLYKNRKRKIIKRSVILAISFLNHNHDGTTKIVVDHINNIQTDDRLENLQLITQRENSSKDKKVGTSKYIGVYWFKESKKWRAAISINGKKKHLGLFKIEYNAHLAYSKKLKELNDQIKDYEHN